MASTSTYTTFDASCRCRLCRAQCRRRDLRTGPVGDGLLSEVPELLVSELKDIDAKKGSKRGKVAKEWAGSLSNGESMWIQFKKDHRPSWALYQQGRAILYLEAATAKDEALAIMKQLAVEYAEGKIEKDALVDVGQQRLHDQALEGAPSAGSTCDEFGVVSGHHDRDGAGFEEEAQ